MVSTMRHLHSRQHFEVFLGIGKRFVGAQQQRAVFQVRTDAATRFDLQHLGLFARQR